MLIGMSEVMKRLDATEDEVGKFVTQGRLPTMTHVRGYFGWNKSDVDALAEQLADEDADQQVDDALSAAEDAREREQELAEDWKPPVSVQSLICRKTQGVKHDDGKIKAALLLDFRNALTAVAEVGTFGADKYTRGGWQSVPDAETRYSDALWRHLLTEGNDEESGLLHVAHAAWNILALLELKIHQESDHGR